MGSEMCIRDRVITVLIILLVVIFVVVVLCCMRYKHKLCRNNARPTAIVAGIAMSNLRENVKSVPTPTAPAAEALAPLAAAENAGMDESVCSGCDCEC